MKIYARLAEVSDVEYLKGNNMYQTAIKYMKMLKEYGAFTHIPWITVTNENCIESKPITVIVFRQADKDDEDRAIAVSYHQYNNEEYTKLPYSTDKDISLVFVDDSRLGEVSFIFHENCTGEYNEIRFIAGDWSRGKPTVCVGEI